MSPRTIISGRLATPAGIEGGEADWRTRGYLPHFDPENGVQFITFRLAGSVPQSIIRRAKLLLDAGKMTDVEYWRQLESALDEGHGPTHLANPGIAAILEENLLHFDGDRYELFHWVLMPTHVHVSLRPNPELKLAAIIHSMKSFTANEANKILGRRGPFWAVEYFDRYIRDGRHFGRVTEYIHNNPVKAHLCDTAAEWRFGCAWHHQDPTHAG
jgi:putative DNA methylase